MNNPILAVLTVTNETVLPKAQLVLRKDGQLDHYGDPSAAVEALALLLRVGPDSPLFKSKGPNPE